jgi:hypothetical protein
MSSFAMPNFNLLAGIWHDPKPNPHLYGPPDATSPVNLANGRVSHVLNSQELTLGSSTLLASSSALFPAGTDVRDISVTGNPDAVEIPLGSGRFYWAAFVDDIAKGFVNEHRWAILPKIVIGKYWTYRWPHPIP